MSTGRREWTRRELLLAFRMYCHTPFGRLHRTNPEIVALASAIGRTPSAVAMKACNFASLDPDERARGIKALGNVSRADRELWEEFQEDSESVAERAEQEYVSLTQAMVDTTTDQINPPSGETEGVAQVKTRRVQSFFRNAVLVSYGFRCALTGINLPELLNASHIIPWSVSEKRRADPTNGLCLNALHDRAFDRGLITFDEGLKLVISSRISDSDICEMKTAEFEFLRGKPLSVPERFFPDLAALEYHRKVVFVA